MKTAYDIGKSDHTHVCQHCGGYDAVRSAELARQRDALVAALAEAKALVAEQSLAGMAATDRETALVEALKTIASIPGLTDYEAAHLDARSAWHGALNQVYSKAYAALAKVEQSTHTAGVL